MRVSGDARRRARRAWANGDGGETPEAASDDDLIHAHRRGSYHLAKHSLAGTTLNFVPSM